MMGASDFTPPAHGPESFREGHDGALVSSLSLRAGQVGGEAI